MIIKVKKEKINIDYKRYSENINERYIENLIKDKKNRMVIHSIDCEEKYYNNITSFIIYRKNKNMSEDNYYIFLMGVHEEIRDNGYGKLILDEFIEEINKYKLRRTNIVIHSLDTSEHFFINYGFERIFRSRFLKNYEGWEDEKNQLIYKLLV